MDRNGGELAGAPASYSDEDSADPMPDVRRALILGSPGSGKSTFARALQKKTGLPAYHLDMLWHLPDHTTVSTEEFDTRLAAILSQPRWILDGNYKRTLNWRLGAADTVFLFDLPAEECLAGITARLGKDRPDIPWGPEKQLDPDFVKYVTAFPRDVMPTLRRVLDSVRTDKSVIVFRSHAEASRFLDRAAPGQAQKQASPSVSSSRDGQKEPHGSL